LYLGFRAWGQPRDKDRTAYWQKTIEGLDEDPDVFFGQVYQALKEDWLRAMCNFRAWDRPTHLFETRSVFSHDLLPPGQIQALSYYLYLGQTPTGMFPSSRVYNNTCGAKGCRWAVPWLSSVKSALSGHVCFSASDDVRA
jgi:hypothetical protein